MTDRDHFAAAALTGLLSSREWPIDSDEASHYCYRVADAMLRERAASTEKASDVRDSRNWNTTDHDAAPAARAESERPLVYEDLPHASGTGKQTAPPCVETDEFSPGSSGGPINRSAERQSPDRERGESSRRDVPQPDNGRAAGGPAHHISEAEIDALECVVEVGRIVGMSVYGRLRSLLVRLRPEWEGEQDSDRPQPIGDARLAALEELSALDQELELSHGVKGNPLIKAQPCKAAKTDTTPLRNGTPAEGSVQGEGTEPVAWGLLDEGEVHYATPFRNEAESVIRRTGDKDSAIVPLYRHPQPTLTDAEREAVEWAASAARNVEHPAEDTLRGLLERLA